MCCVLSYQWRLLFQDILLLNMIISCLDIGGQCRGYEVTSKSFNLLKYSPLYYLIIQAVILTSCCVIMTACTINIFYKIKTNKCKGSITERGKQEKRSLIMFGVVLFVFLISVVFKVCAYLIFRIKYIAGFETRLISSEQYSTVYSVDENNSEF